MLSAVPGRPTALLVRLTFKESWDADNNPTTPCCEKTFHMVAEGFDTALVILAGVALSKARTHTQRTAQAIAITYHLNTALFIYSRIFHYYCHESALSRGGIKRIYTFIWKFGALSSRVHFGMRRRTWRQIFRRNYTVTTRTYRVFPEERLLDLKSALITK